VSVAEWTDREVCPDGACIGVIGDDGTCKVCGRTGERGPRALVDDQTDAPPDESLAADEDDDELEPADEGDDDHDADESTGGDDWDRRELCSNGACVGVIGDADVCTVCGSPRA
jgi:hypothetical protein